MATCLIALGANLGDRQHTLRTAVDRLSQDPALEVVCVSAWRGTRPIGGPAGQADFLNGAALVETSLAPLSLLKVLEHVENALGRTRDQHWAARTIDLDLLLYDDQVIDQPNLQVPHPRMSFRRFVLEPAAEVAAAMVHPTIGRTLAQLLAHLDHALPYIALCGPPAVGKTQLAQVLHEKIDATVYCDAANLPGIAASDLGFSAELKLLEHRAAQLDRATIQGSFSQVGPYLVSDFGLHQSLAHAKLQLSVSEFQVFLLRWEQLFEQVAVPKLLIALDAPSDVLDERLKTPGKRSVQSLEALRVSMKDAITKHVQGPILQLDATCPDLVLAETLAAIEAMGK